MTDKKPLDPKVQDGIAAAVDEYLATRRAELVKYLADIEPTVTGARAALDQAIADGQADDPEVMAFKADVESFEAKIAQAKADIAKIDSNYPDGKPPKGKGKKGRRHAE